MDIDPTQITHDNMPTVVGTMLVMLEEQNKDLKAHGQDLKDVKERVEDMSDVLDGHSAYINLLKFSFCSIIPWLRSHKCVVAVFFFVISVWFSALDWLNRWLQWTFSPPGMP